jgi:hypothetical protein
MIELVRKRLYSLGRPGKDQKSISAELKLKYVRLEDNQLASYNYISQHGVEMSCNERNPADRIRTKDFRVNRGKKILRNLIEVIMVEEFRPPMILKLPAGHRFSTLENKEIYVQVERDLDHKKSYEHPGSTLDMSMAITR